MSTSYSRRERRALQRMREMPADKLVRKIRKVLPNIPLNPNMVKGDMTYQQWLNEVEITPEMLEELEMHDKAEQSKPKPLNVQTKKINKLNNGFEYEEVK
jgi:hypothetical protein